MNSDLKRIKYSLVIPLLITIVFWTVHLFKWEFDLNMYLGGIYPRAIKGMPGILTSAFIHDNLKHLLANTPSFLILAWCLYYFYKDIANRVLLFLYFLSGVMTWIVGRPAYHVGISGVIYALAFFIFFSALFRKNMRLSAVALIIVFIYGSMFWNLLPVTEYVNPKISWEGHLCGAFAGIIAAVAYRKEGPANEVSPFENEEDTEDNEEDRYWEIKNNNEKDII